MLAAPGPSPRGGSPKKEVNKVNKERFPNLSLKNRGLKLRFLAFTQGPGGFREVREAVRNHFHLSWYILVPGITSYGPKRSLAQGFSLNGPCQRGAGGYTSCRCLVVKNALKLSKNIRPERSLNAGSGHSKPMDDCIENPQEKTNRTNNPYLQSITPLVIQVPPQK